MSPVNTVSLYDLITKNSVDLANTGIVGDLALGKTYRYLGYFDGFEKSVLDFSSDYVITPNNGDFGSNVYIATAQSAPPLSWSMGARASNGAGDHYMLVNGSSDIRRAFWKHSFAGLQANTDYTLHFDMMNGTYAPRVQLVVNGLAVGSPIELAWRQGWTEVSVTFRATSSNLNLELRDLNNQGVGNDIGLDNLVLVKGSASTTYRQIDMLSNATNLTGTSKDDQLFGDAGRNVLDGSAGDDYLDGRAGNDTLKGGAGNDTYVFHRGGGQDLIMSASSDLTQVDTLRFGSTIKQTDLRFSRSNQNLVIGLMNSTDQVTIQDWYLGATNRIGLFVTADGRTLNSSDADSRTGDFTLTSLAVSQAQWLKSQFPKDASFISLKTAMDGIAADVNLFPVSTFGNYLNDPAHNVVARMPLTGKLRADVEAFTLAYDNAYSTNQAIFSGQDQLNSVYATLVNGEYLAHNSVGPANLSSAVRSMFTWLGDQHNVLVPQIPPATGADVIAYCASVDASLGLEFGKFKNLINDASAIQSNEKDLEHAIINATTGLTLSLDVIGWLMNGAPQSSMQGGISYNGKNGLTYGQALLSAEADLFVEADIFVKTCTQGIKQVIANKEVADQKALISQIFDIIGGVASGLAGIGKTYIAVDALRSSQSVANLLKVESEIASDLSTVSSLIKNETADWLKPQKSAVSGQLAYNQIGKVLTDVTDLLSDTTPSALTSVANEFTQDLGKLVVMINTNLKHGVDTLFDRQFINSAKHRGWSFDDFPNLSIAFKDFFGATQHMTIDTHSFYSQGTPGHGWMGEEIRTKDVSIPGYLVSTLTVDYHNVRNMGYLPEIILHGYNVI